MASDRGPRVVKAVVGAPRQAERVTHGRHCSCSACAREDWTRITAPCGMHGAGCPAIYAPIRDPELHGESWDGEHPFGDHPDYPETS